MYVCMMMVVVVFIDGGRRVSLLSVRQSAESVSSHALTGRKGPPRHRLLRARRSRTRSLSPKRQPMRRPAFEEILPHCHGSEPRICVLPDEPELVATCKAALERESTEANEAAVSALARGRRRASGTSLSAPLLKRMKANASE